MKEATKKAVILARGLGTRMRAATGDAVLDAAQAEIAAKGLKALMPLGDGRVLLDVIIARLRAAGAGRICLVVGPEQHEFRDFCAAREYDVEFAVQAEPRGTADAVLAARDFAAGDRFLVVNSDNLYPVECLAKLFSLDGAGLIGFEFAGLVENGNIPAERIQKFATLETDAAGFLTKIIEKPEVVASDAIISMNCWVFSAAIFTACEAVERSPRGEFELTAAVMYAIDTLGESFSVIRSNQGVLDLSSRVDVAAVAARLTEA